MRGLANLDALVARAALLGPEGPPVSRRSVAPSADGGSADRSPDSDADRNPGEPTSEQKSGAEGGRITDRVKSWTDERGVSSAVSAEGWSWLASAIVAIAAFAINWPLLSVIYGVHPAIALALTAAHAGAVLLTVRTPQVAIALNALAVFSTAMFTMETVGSP